ncbi:MAG: TIGR00366 family protein, partial [Gammaproteobacteria bacterium]|nr:TIGR00366 family protein [Gammaproteobacteria bacterium]
MIQASADFFSRVMQRWLPDAFLFAIILTAVIFLSGMVFEEQSATQMANYWGGGFWNLLSFSMQMVLILLFGHILAMTKPIKAGLVQIAKLANTPAQGIVLVTAFAVCAAWVNWGFGIVVGFSVAREVAARVKGIHFPLLIASVYSGFLVWHGGLSGSIPLLLASPEQNTLSNLMNGQVIDVSQTLFSSQNITIILALLISLPILNLLMMPKDNIVEFQDTFVEEVEIDKSQMSPAEKLEHSPILSYLFAGLSSLYLFNYFADGGGLNLNT